MSNVWMLLLCHLNNLAVSSFPTVMKTLASDLPPHHLIGDFFLRPEDLSFLIPPREWTQLPGHSGMRAGSWEIPFLTSQPLPCPDRHSQPLRRARRCAGYFLKFPITNHHIVALIVSTVTHSLVIPPNRLPGSAAPRICSPLSPRKEPSEVQVH